MAMKTYKSVHQDPLDAIHAKVERLMKNKAIRNPVKALARALKGSTDVEIMLVGERIRDHLSDKVMVGDNTVQTYLPMVRKRGGEMGKRAREENRRAREERKRTK